MDILQKPVKAKVNLQMTCLSLELFFFFEIIFSSELPSVDSGILVLQINMFQSMNTVHSAFPRMSFEA